MANLGRRGRSRVEGADAIKLLKIIQTVFYYILKFFFIILNGTPDYNLIIMVL